MATLQTLRNKAGWLLIGLLGLALLSFVLTDLFTSGSAWINKLQDRAFSVDGQTVSTGEYQNRITEWEEFQKFISGGVAPDENTSSQIRERVYQEMVKEIMLDKEAEKLGISVTKEEMNDMVYGQNISPILTGLPLFVGQDGQFSREVLNSFLELITAPQTAMNEEQRLYAQSYKAIWTFIQRIMKYQRLEEKYNSLLMGAVMTNNIEAKEYADDTQYTTNVAYVLQPYSTLPDSTVSVSNSEIQKLYNQRKESFRIYNNLAKVTYFVRNIQPSGEDIQNAEKTALEAQQALINNSNAANVVAQYSDMGMQDIFIATNRLNNEEQEFVRTASIGEVQGPTRSGDAFNLYKLLGKTTAPDSVRIQFMAFPEIAGQKSIADSVLSVLKEGKDFATVAQELQQPGGIDPQWVTEFSLASAGKEIINACFNTPAGQTTKVATNGQTTIIKVTERTRPTEKVKLAFIQIPIIASERTQNTLDTELNSFISQFGSAENFLKGAEEKGYNVIPDAMVSTADANLRQISGTREIIRWAFSEKPGSIKKFDFADKRIVALLNSQITGKYLPQAEVADALKAELIKDKKAEKMIHELSDKNLNTLEAYANATNEKIDTVKYVNFDSNSLTGLGYEPIVTAYAAHAQPGQLFAPLKGENGVLALLFTNREETPSSSSLEEIRTRLQQSTLYRIMSQSMPILQTKMDVKDNRVKFF